MIASLRGCALQRSGILQWMPALHIFFWLCLQRVRWALMRPQ